MTISGFFRSARGQTGMALMPLVLTFVIAGALIGAGMQLVGPKSQRMRLETTRNLLDRASRSIIAWSAANGRLPTAAEFVSAAGGLCGRESTGIVANGVVDTAFFILSGGDDFTVDTTPAGSGAYAGNADPSVMDLVKAVTLPELRNQAGCFHRTAGRLALLNNELPEGCNGDPYLGELYARGGVPPYTWSMTTVPTWLTLTPAGDACHCTGTPYVLGVYTVGVRLVDSVGTVVERHFDIMVDTCIAGPPPISQWDFNGGTGATAGDGLGANIGTRIGNTAWSLDYPDGIRTYQSHHTRATG